MISASTDKKALDDARRWCATRLIEILLPNDNGLLAVFEAYFDETGRDLTGAFCVAGHVYTPPNARALSRAWFRVLKGRTFRAADAFHLRGDFKDCTHADISRIVQRLVEIIRRHAAQIVVVSCNIKEVEALQLKSASAKSFAYQLTTHAAMAAVGDWAKKFSGERLVAYMFDQGHEAMGAANFLLEGLLAHPDGADIYSYHSHTFQPSKSSAALQAADLIAYECGKVWDEQIYSKKGEGGE